MSNQIEITKTESNLNYCSYKKAAVAATGPDAKPLPKMTVDGNVIEFMPGDTIMQALERVNSADEVPRYCYHPGMPIAGTCRMCTVEVEKAPKLMTSCSTPAGDGMVVHTRSEKVLKSRTGVMEFLLTNHPLDCPVCDKAGECELQDYNHEYGPVTSRFKEEKRVFDQATTKNLSDKIVLNMNRCVHCERCVRFTDDVTKTNDLVMLNRGWHKELSATDEERGMWNEYQGNLADFCPVGALTWTDFRFEKRVWFLRKDASICDGCAKGCNMEVHSEKEVAYRLMPIFNEKVNGHWMCDEGREQYHVPMNPQRIGVPMLISSRQDLSATSWETLAPAVKGMLKTAQKTLVLISTDATNEEAQAMKKELASLAANVEIKAYNGTPGIKLAGDNKALDHLLRQSDKTPNTRGLENLGLKIHDGKVSGYETVVVYRSGRAKIPEITDASNIILWGVWNASEVKKYSQTKAVIPGLHTIEKEGSFTNCDGITQHFKMAIKHRGLGLSVNKVLELIKG